MTRYVTVKMIARHAKKAEPTVLRALTRASVTLESVPGARGYRIKEKDANTFLARQWPEAGPLPLHPQ